MVKALHMGMHALTRAAHRKTLLAGDGMPRRNMNKTRFSVIRLLIVALALLCFRTAEAQPANDMFTNVQLIVPTWNGNQTDTSGTLTLPRPAWTYYGEANLIGATLEPGEPNHANANGIASVWFSYTAPAAGELRIVATNGSTAVAVYTGGQNGTYFAFDGNLANNMGLTVNPYNTPTYAIDASPDPESVESLQLNGTSSYLDIMDSFEPTAYTVSVWVKVPTVQAMGIIGRTSSSGISSGVYSHDLHITAAGVFEHYTSTGSSGYTVTGTTVVQPNTWYHVAIVATVGGQELLYVNGVSQGTPNTIPALWNGGDRWQVGTPPPGSNYFNGELGGLAIYNVALTGTQIAAIASSTTTPASYFVSSVTALTAVGSSTTGTVSISTTPGINYSIAFACPGANIYSYPFNFYFFPPPGNDNFANTAVIPNAYTMTNFSFSQVSGSIPIITYATNGSTLYATPEAGEEGGNSTSGTVIRSVWYSFVAPTNGYFSVSANCSYDQYLDIGQGTPSNFTNVISSGMTGAPSLNRMLVAGQTYLIRVWTSSSWSTWSGLFSMNVLFYPQPPNDNWTNRTALPLQTANTIPYALSYGIFSGTWNQTVNSNSWLANAYGATRETGEQSGGESIWWGYTPPSAGALTLSASNYFGGLAFWLETAQSVSSVQQIAGNNQGGNYANNTTFSANVIPTTNYTVSFANWNSQEEDAGQIQGIFYPSPANDMFSTRQTFPTTYNTNYITWQGQTMLLSVDQVASVSGSTLGATVESGEQWSGFNRSIWYSWTPTRPQTFDLNTYGSVKPDGQTHLTTFLVVNTGTAVNALSQPFGYAQGNNGVWGGYTGLTPVVGTEYEIQVMDENGNSGGGITLLNWRQYVPQTNDYFSNAIPVTQVQQVLSDGSILETNLIYGATSNATVEASEPNNSMGSVWYKWAADTTGTAYIAMSSSFNGNLYVYTGSSVSALTTAAGPYTGVDGRSWVSFNAVSNTTYSIQVRSSTGTGGAFALSFYEYSHTGSLINGNISPSTAFNILPTNINSYGQYSASLNGNATNSTLPTGSTNALADLINSGVQLNANYNTNFAGSNSLWWSYTAVSNNELVVYNSAMTASAALRSGLGYDPDMNPVNLANPFGENANIVFTPQGAYFTNISSASDFSSRPTTGGAFRLEMTYMYVSNPGYPGGYPPSPYNVIVLGNSAYYDPLVVRTTDMMLGTYNNGTFTPFNFNLTAGQEYYIALECDGLSGSSDYTLWINNVQIGTVNSGFDGNSYYPMGFGANGGRVHDVRYYNTSPVTHEAFEIWQGGSMVEINNDMVMMPCTAGTTYRIRTTPLEGQGVYFPFNGSTQNSLGLAVNSYNSPVFTNDASPDPGATQSIMLFGNNPYTYLVPDGGFEVPGPEGNYTYNPGGGAWTYVGYSGIIPQGNGAWGGAVSGYGSQYGFVQQTGFCYETISNMLAGTYSLSFLSTSRPGYAAQTFNVLIDGTIVGSFNPASSTTFTAETTGNFTVAAGNHVLEFQGTDVGGGDRTAFIDNVIISQNSGGGGINYNNYLDIMDSFVPTSSTVSVWVKIPTVQAMGIIGRTTSAGIPAVESDDLSLTAGGVFQHYVYSGSTGYTVTGTTVIQPNTWYHVAIAASAGGQELLYVNGVSQGTPVTVPALSSLGDRWQVGTAPSGDNFFAGELGGLAIYHNTVLTPSQIAGLAAGTISPLSLINYDAQFTIKEFNLMEEYHNIDDPKVLTFTNAITSWNLPNGAASSTNYMTGDSCFYTEGYWGPEWNPAGITAPGGDLWYTFVAPISGGLLTTDPYSSSLGEYLVVFSPHSTITGSSPLGQAWNSMGFTATGGQQYWLENGINGQGLSGVNLLLEVPPPNDAFANATPITLTTNAIVTTIANGNVTNYTMTANLVGQNYQATADPGGQNLGNYTGIGVTGHTVWWTFVPPTNGWVSIDPTQSSFITQMGLLATSQGVGGNYSYGGGTVVYNTYITNFPVSAGVSYSICIDGSSQDSVGMGGINLNVLFVPVPPNDNFAGATVVTLQTNVLAGTVPDGTTYYTNLSAHAASHNIGATQEGSENSLGNTTGSGEPWKSVWFNLVPQQSGYLSIASSNSTFPTQCGIKLASVGVGGSWVYSSIATSGNGYIPSTSVYVTAGTSYMIEVDGTTTGANYGFINLDLNMTSSPGNDNFANATVIPFTTNDNTIPLPNGTATNITFTAGLAGNNFSASTESGESLMGNTTGVGDSQHTVWWTFVAPMSGFLKVASTNSTFPNQLGVKTTAVGAGGSWTYSSMGVTTSGFLTGLTVAAGTSYSICVDGTGSGAGSGLIDLDVEIDAYPSNDVYPGATMPFATVTNLQTYEGYTVTNLSYVATAVGANTYATLDGYNLGNRQGVNDASANIWWNFVAPTTGNATVSLLGSTFDTLLGAGVYSSATTYPPYGNDDYQPGVVQSQVIVPVTAGQTNMVEVDGKTGTSEGGTGGANVTITLPVPPANDLFANATILYPSNGVPIISGSETGNLISVAGSTIQATSSGENWVANGYLNAPVNQNVWFKYTPTNPGLIYLSVNSPGSHLIAVYTSFNGTWVGGCVGTEGATPNSSFSFAGTSGTAYYICIDGTIPGPFVLNVATFYGGPPNQSSTNSIPLTNNTPTLGTVVGTTNGPVWYSFTPTCTGLLEVDTEGSTANAALTAYSGQLTGTYFAFDDNTINTMGLTVNPYSSPTYTNDASPDPGSVASLQLNGTSSYLDVMDPSLALSSYTVSAWVKVPSVRAVGIIGATTSSGVNSGVYSHDLHITSSGVFEHYTSTGSSSYTVTGTTVIQPNTWYHVAIVATVGGQELLYVNGASQGTPNSIPALWQGGTKWQVGVPPPGYNYFNGELGGLTIYHNLALTPSQIYAIATGAVSPASYITANNAILSQLSTTPTSYGISLPVNAGMTYEIELAINNNTNDSFVITPHLTCAGYVSADPAAGNFIDVGNVSLTSLGGGTIYYSLNGGSYQTYTNESQISLANIQNVTAAGGVVTKTAGGSSWNNGGFTSVQSLPGSGFAECLVTMNNQDFMFGLESVYTSAAYQNIDYAIYAGSSGSMQIYEAGTSRGTFQSYHVGDRLRVQRSGQTISYYQNGILFYTSTVPCTASPMYLAASIYEQNASLGPCFLSTPAQFTSGDVNGNVTLSAYTTLGETNTWSYTVQAAAPVVLKGSFPTWTNAYSSSLTLAGGTDGQVLSKSASQGTWQGVFSLQNTTGDCSIDWIDSSATIDARGGAGLSSSAAFNSWNNITFGVYNDYGIINIYESGNNRGNFGNSSPGDVFRVERKGSSIYYYQNGNLLYTSTLSSSGTLSAAMALQDIGYSIGPAAFYQASNPTMSVITNAYGATTLYSSTAYPRTPPAVNALSPAVGIPIMAATPATDYGFGNHRIDVIPSPQTTLNFTGLLPPVFQITNATLYTPLPITVLSPSGIGGLWSITYPSGSAFVTNTGASMSFTPQGGGLYKASLLAGTQTVSTSTNLYFVVSDLTVTPSTNYSSIPFYVYAGNTWPMSIYYAFTSALTPNIPYTGPISLGNTNVTIYFMGVRTGFAPQFANGTYVYSPTISITPSGTFNNATTFTINAGGAPGLQYLVSGSTWQSYNGPFVVNGIPTGTGTIQAYYTEGSQDSNTNSTQITFKVATVTATPAAGPVSGTYTVTPQIATTNASIYWAMGDNLGNPPSTNAVTNLYTTPISMTGSRTFTFIAREANYQDSAPASFTYVARLAEPSFVTPTCTNNGPLVITVAAGDTNGGVLKLTDPFNNVQSATATNGTASFTINAGVAYILFTALTGWSQSPSATNNYYFVMTDLGILPPGNCIYSPVSAYFTASPTNTFPTVYYTTNGSTPTTGSALYTANIPVSQTTTITALGVRPGYTSQIITNTYTFMSPATVSPSAGTYSNTFLMVLTDAQATTLYYQINGGAWQVYSGPATIDGTNNGSVTISTRYDSTGCPGPTNGVSYSFQVAAPVITPTSTTIGSGIHVSASDATTGASVYYAIGDTNGNAASAASITNLYTGPIAVTSTRQFLFQAFKTNYASSAQVSETYSSPLPTPWFVTPSQMFTNQAAITVASALNAYQSFVLAYPDGSSLTNTVTGSTTTFNINQPGTFSLQVFDSPWLPSASATNSYSFQVSDLAVTPPSENFVNPLTVTASAASNPLPLTIYYTTDGSTPTTSSTAYTSPLTVTNTTTLQFMGVRQGYAPEYVSRQYNFAPGVTVTPGTSTNTLAISITFTTNSGNSVAYYRFNGGAWNNYSAPISVDGYGSGTLSMDVYAVTGPIYSSTNTYVYTFQVGAITVSPASENLGGPISVTAATSTPGASLYYAEDLLGNNPTLASATNLYTGAITVTNTVCFLFSAAKAGYMSELATSVYSGQLPPPTFLTLSQTFSNQATIVLQSGLAGTGSSWVIVDPNGVTNTATSGTSTLNWNINVTGTYIVQNTKANWQNSAAASNSYSFGVEDLSVTPPTEEFNNSLVVTAQSSISDPAPLVIYYTTNGTAATTNSSLYSGPLTITNSATFIWLATRAGYAPEAATNVYTYASPIVFTPGSGTYSNAITVALSTGTPGATMLYSFDGINWGVYTSPFTLDGINSGSGTLSVYYNNGVTWQTNLYTLNFIVGAPAISPASENISGPVSVTVSSTTLGARLYYAENLLGNNPVLTDATNLYTGAITITNTACFLVNATKTGYLSTQAAAVYSGVLPTPTFLTPAQTFSNQAAIAIQSGLAGTISSWVVVSPNVVTNTTTSPSSTLYLNINASGTYLVQNTKPNWQNSAFASNSYTFAVQDLSVTPASGVYHSNLTITAQSSISDPTPLVIYYTTDGTLPTTSSAVYVSPLTISSNTTTFIWLASRTGYTSELATNSYSYVPPIVFSPGAGTYANPITVTLSTAAPGASMFYSIDGINWNSYSGAFTLDGINSGAGTLSVYYTTGAMGMTNSWPINFAVAPLTVNPSGLTLSGPISVTAVSATTGATIDYSIDANSLLTTALTNTYTGAFTVSNRSFLVFQGFKSGYQSTAQVTEKYIEQLPAPDFLTANNTVFTNVASVTIEDQRASENTTFDITGPDGEISAGQRYYPDSNGFPYTIISMNASGPYAAYVWGPDWITSSTITNYYTFVVGDLVTTANALFNTPTTTVTASSSLGGGNPKPLVIYYTLDGSQPSTSSILYTGPITLTNTTTVTWIGTRNGYGPQYATNLYGYVPPVTATPLPGTNNNAIDITLSVANGQPVSYTLDGATWQGYDNQPIHIDGYNNGVLNLSATYTGGLTNTFTYCFATTPPIVTPAGGLITSNIQVTATSGGTTDCFIYYYAGDLGGGTANMGLAPILYMGPVAVTGSRNLVFQATKTGYTDSPLVNMDYMAQLPPLQVLTSGGAFTNMVSVSLAAGLSGFGGTYNMVHPDGSTTVISSSSPSVSFNVNGTGTYTFYMARAGWVNSPSTNWSGTFQVTDLQINPNSPVISDPTYPITATGDPSNPKPLVIYYTLDGSLPTTGSLLFSVPLTCSTDTTVTWLATRDGYSPEYQTNAYHYIAGASLSPTNAVFYNAQQFTITGFGTGTIYYRTNYSPWVVYTGPFTIDGQAIIDYYVSSSQVASLTNEFVAKFQVAQPSFTPVGQVESGPITLTASCSTTNAAIYYDMGDINGNWPSFIGASSATGPVYSGGLTPYAAFIWPPGNVSFTSLVNLYTNSFPFDGQTTRMFVFIGRKVGYYDSAFTNTVYTAILPLPVSALGNNITISVPTVNTLTSSIAANWSGQSYAINTTAVQPTYTKAGAYSYTTWRWAWANSPTLTVNVSFAQPANFTNSLPLEMVQPGTVYTIGRMPDLYEAVGTLANSPTMWYNWTAPANGFATVAVLNNETGASNAFICAMGQGSSSANFTALSSNYVSSTIAVVGAQEYQMGIYQYDLASTNFQVDLSFVPEPANDNFANAYPLVSTIQSGQPITGYTFSSTTEPGEPAGANTVWFEYDCYQPGVLAVYPSGGNISLWQGTSVAGLTPVPQYYTTPMDPRWTDINFVMEPWGPNPEPNTLYNTKGVDFNLTQPGTYYLRLSGPPSVYTNQVEFHLRPINDNFENPIDLPMVSYSGTTAQLQDYTYSYSYTSEGATLQAGEPANPMGPATVWYRWQAPGNGAFSVGATLTAQTFDQDPEALFYPCQIDMYQGNSLTELQTVPSSYTNSTFSVDTTASPTNTSWDTAWPLNGSSVTVTEPNGGSGTWWFTYVSPATGTITVDAGGVWSVESGSRLQDAVLIGEADGYGDSGPGTFSAVKGETYHILIPGGDQTFALFPSGSYNITAQAGQLYYIRLSGTGFRHTITGSFASQPGNDNLANASVITLTPNIYDNGVKSSINVSGSLDGASSEPGENITAADGTVSSHTVWYAVTPPFSGKMTTDTGDTVYNNVYTVTNGATLSMAALTPIPTVTFDVVAGQTYYIQVLSAADLPFALYITLIELPVNDMWSNALPLSISQFYAYNNYATTEPGEPAEPFALGASVWWSYSPSRNGTLVLTTSPQIASIWQGSNFLDMTMLSTEIPTNDAYGNNTMVPIVQNLSAGQQYWIAVDSTLGYDMGDGDIQVSASYYPFPSNDDFSQATPLTSWTTYPTDNGDFYFFWTSGDNYGATSEAQEPAGQTNSIWYSWTAPAKLLVYPSIYSSYMGGGGQWGGPEAYWAASQSLVANVYRGTSLQNLQPVNNTFFVAQPGEIYYIAICGAQGTFQFEWNTVTFPTDDMEANAIPFVGAASTLVLENYGASRESFEQTIYNNSVWAKWNSGAATNMFIGLAQVGPNPLVFPENTVNEVTVYDDQMNVVTQETNNIPWSPNIPLINMPVGTNRNYYISAESSAPGTLLLQLSANPQGQTNISNLNWTPQNIATNLSLWSAPANAQAPTPWFYYLNLPASGNILVTGDGGGGIAAVAADGSAFLIQSGVTNNYTMLMPATVNQNDMIGFPDAGGTLIVDVLPPVNDLRANAMPMPLTASGRNFTTTFTTCNWMGSTEGDGMVDSVWYQVYVPVNGVAQIVNSPFVNASSSTTLHWIQTDATSLGTMASANLINDQVCQLSGVYAGVINVNVAQGYYYVVQSDGPGLATFGVTVSPAPPNDNFTNATPFAWAVSASYSNGKTYAASYLVDVNGASVEPGEPPTIGQRTVWYSTTVPSAGQITFNNQDSVYTGDGTMAGLQELFGAGQGTGALNVTAGENLWIQASGSGTAYINPGAHSMQLLVQPFNDNIANAINMASYTQVTPTNWNGQQVYMYTFQAPAGFWTLASDGHYVRNWYGVHGTTNLLSVTVSQPDSAAGYYDFGAGIATEMQYNQVVYGPGSHFYYPNVWGYSPYDINVPQVWAYNEEQLLYSQTGTDPTYRGLFDMTAFPTGPGISYLYAVPKNILFQSVQSVLLSNTPPSTVASPSPCTYTFILAHPDTIWLAPVFPCAASQPILLTAQVQTQQTTAYDYLATIETNEVTQPGSYGSVWWSMTMPLSGALTVTAKPNSSISGSQAPLIYIWRGTAMNNLQMVASTYSNNLACGQFNAGDPVMISADIGPAGPGLFDLTMTEGPPVINATPDQSEYMLPYTSVAFENSSVWDYSQQYTLQLGATNLWYRIKAAPGSGWLQRLDADPTTVVLYQPVLQDLQLIPPSCAFSGTLTVNVSTENDVYGPMAIYYTTDGSTPTTNSPVYTAPFALTGTTTINLLGVRPGRTPETCTATYSYQGTVQCSLASDGNYSGPVTFTLSDNNTNATLLYRITGGNWITYTNAVTLDGISSGSGYVYFTQLVNGQTNALQFVHAQFTAGPPQVNPLNAVFQGNNIALSDTTGETVSYTKLTINQLVAGGFADNAAVSANQSSPGTFTGSLALTPGNYMFQFQTQKAGYQLSMPVTGTYLLQPQP